MRFIILVILAGSWLTILSAKAVDVSAINSAIALRRAQWAAQENSLTILSKDERVKRLGLKKDMIRPDGTQMLSIPVFKSLPDSLDWRNLDGNWVTPVRDQGACGSCWAFSALAQVESWWKIRWQMPDIDFDLSEQFLLSCSDAGTCEEGGMVSASFDFIQQQGVPLEKYLPYQAKTNISCAQTQDGWEGDAVQIPGWGYVTFGEAQVENIKTALLYHPVSASFEVFADFYAYHSGVYEHVFGDSEGWHAVLIVGWNDREQSWIVKNSWGSGWGEKGYFRIKWGQSNFGLSNEFIWDDLSSSGITLSTQVCAAELVYGASDSVSFTLTNDGSMPLWYYAVETPNSDEEADWLQLEKSAGFLPVGGNSRISGIISTQVLLPGEYKRAIQVITNNPGEIYVVNCTLVVNSPDYDARVTDVILPPAGYPMLTFNSPQAKIDNFGLFPLENVLVKCTIHAGGSEIYQDSIEIQRLESGETRPLTFRPFKAAAAAPLEVRVQIAAEGDQNDFNDEIVRETVVTHLVDDFEYGDHLWQFVDGWGLDSRYSGHSGTFSAHVAPNSNPYPNLIKTLLVYAPGFETSDIDTLVLTYFTRYVTADLNDFCRVEISGDSAQWRVVDEYSGVHPPWMQKKIDLTPLIEEGYAKAWFRFRFQSNESGGSLGVWIDDVHVYTHSIRLDNSGMSDINMPSVEEQSSPFSPSLVNYPNPFNPATTFVWMLSEPARVRLDVYNIVGQLKETLVDQDMSLGQHSLHWNAADAPAGVYFVQLTAFASERTFVNRHKIILLR